MFQLFEVELGQWEMHDSGKINFYFKESFRSHGPRIVRGMTSRPGLNSYPWTGSYSSCGQFFVPTVFVVSRPTRPES